MTPPAAPKPRGFGAGVTKVPHPIAPLYRLRTVAAIFGRTMSGMNKTLYRHADRFDHPMYQRGRNGKLYRVLSDHDLRVLSQLWPLYVKGKLSRPNRLGI